MKKMPKSSMIKTPANKKINSFFSFHGSYIGFCKGKPTVFGTAFDRKPGFKTENLIKYRIHCRHYGGACMCVCVCVCVCVSERERRGLQQNLVPTYFGRL